MVRHNLPRKNVYRSEYAIDNAALSAYAPSVLAAEPHRSRKDSYAFVPTIQVIDALRKEGFECFEVSQRNTRTPDRLCYTKHMVRMRHHSAFGKEEVPELILTNSHDGSSSYELMSGIFRFICSNGLISGDIFESYKVRHMGNIVEDVVTGTYKVMEQVNEITDRIDLYKTTELTADEQMHLAGTARTLVWGQNAPVSVEDLLLERRYQDAGKDLWRTFNRIQENVISGGLSGRSVNGRRITTRGVQSISRSVDVNRQLWNLADQLAMEKA